MTDKEKESWKTLCEYVKSELLNYTPNMKFPKYLALRLKGLAEGKFISNKNIESNANYTYEQIYITCKFCSQKIKNYFIDNSAKITDEKHKINLIMMFVENEINNVVIKIKNRQNIERQTESLTFEILESTSQYKKTTDNKKNRLDDLW